MHQRFRFTASWEGQRVKVSELAYYWLSLVAIIVFALFPVGCVALAMTVAQANGCALDEGSIHPCLVHGVDYGGALTTLFVMGWLGLLTLPAGAVALLVWALVGLALVVRRRLQAR